jgi:hypothetical protein
VAYFTVAEFRARHGVLQADHDDDAVNAARVTAEEIIERECHVAFEPREETLVLSGDGGTRLGIPRHRVRSVSAAAVNEVAVATPGDLTLHQGSVYRTI